MNTNPNWKVVSLVVLVACATVAVWATLPAKPAASLHRDGRQFTVSITPGLDRDPIIVLGDSIVEASTLPRSICGRAVVNAGLNGSSTASDLGNWLAGALRDRRAAMIIVSLGGNDAMAPAAPDKEAFAAAYRALLERLAKLTPRLAVLQVVPVEAQGRMTPELRDQAMRTIGSYNAVLPDVAARSNAAFIALPSMPSPFTVDGTHLNVGGYASWDQAVMQAAKVVCN